MWAVREEISSEDHKVMRHWQWVQVNLVKQLQKLVKVRYVEDITEAERVERELVLLKIRAPPGPTRTEVMQLIDIFRARVVDVSDRSLTISVTGDAGKVEHLQMLKPAQKENPFPSSILLTVSRCAAGSGACPLWQLQVWLRGRKLSCNLLFVLRSSGP